MNVRSRQFVFVATLIAIPLAAWFMVFSPRSAEITSAVQDIRQRQARLDCLSDVMSQVPDLEAALDEGERLIAQVEAKLPRRQHVEGILERIWQMARRQNLTVRSVKTRTSERTGVYMELPLDVDMAGPFDGFYRFLLELESLPRITRMTDLTLKEASRELRRGTESPPPGSVSAKFTLRIYFADAVPSIAMKTESQ